MAADVASLQETRLRAYGLIEQNQQLIDEIDAALCRLADGTYGASKTTGQPITHDRLLLIPWANTAANEEEP